MHADEHGEGEGQQAKDDLAGRRGGSEIGQKPRAEQQDHATAQPERQRAQVREQGDGDRQHQPQAICREQRG